MRRLELGILYWSTRAALILLLPLFISDVYLYEDYAQKLLKDGLIPYSQWDLEYPPLAYPLMLLPGLVQKWLGFASTESFKAFFGLLLLPFDWWIYKSLVKSPPVRAAAFQYILLTCAMGLLTFDRFDIAVGFMLVLPFLGYRRRPSEDDSSNGPQDSDFIVSWGLGGALKLVPLALAPLPVLSWKKFSLWRFIKYGVLMSLPIAISCAAAAALAGGKISFLSHHSERGVQIESLVGSLLMAAQSFFNLVDAGVQSNFGAQHIGDVKGAVLGSRILFYGALLVSYLGLWWRRRVMDSLSSSWILISGFVTFGYVLSPQFLLWLIPIGLMAASRVPAGRKRAAWLLIFSFAVVLTGIHFRFYWDYVNLYRLSSAAVVGRNGLLVLLWGLSWCWMRKLPALASVQAVVSSESGPMAGSRTGADPAVLNPS